MFIHKGSQLRFEKKMALKVKVGGNLSVGLTFNPSVIPTENDFVK